MANTKEYLVQSSFWMQAKLVVPFSVDNHALILNPHTQRQPQYSDVLEFSGLLFLSGPGAICTIYILQKVAMCIVHTFK